MPQRTETQAFEAALKLLSEEGGRVAITCDPDNEGEGYEKWMVAMEWGREAPDSPMVAAASYHFGTTALEALNKVLDEAGVH